jgi:RecB family endonuclease NucS
LSEYYDNEEEEYVRGILVLDLGSKIPYKEKNNKLLEEFALKLKKFEDEKELKKLNKIT